MMKKTFAVLVAVFMLAMGTPAGAQSSYEGTNLTEGIYYVPDQPGPDSVINFAATGFEANSDVEVRLVDSNNNEIDGLAEVKGAVVLRADSAGNINADLKLPSNIGEGTYRIVVTGTKADSTTFDSELVLQVAGATQVNDDAGSQAGTLALTGSEPQSRAFGGVLLVVLGLGLVVVASQRRSADVNA